MKKQSQLIKGCDWDVLIVLDACRFDVFEKVNNIPGRLQKVNSESYNTSSWYRKHWGKGNADDITLISAQPMPWWINYHNNFYDAILVNAGQMEPDWVDPKYTIDKALEIDDCDQRLLIHLIPPHLPYQGVEGKGFLDRIGAKETASKLWAVKLGVDKLKKRIEGYGKGGNWGELKSYYKENLKYGLCEVDRYLKHTLRKVAITSDHGEELGENNRYGHSTPCPLLCEVPWLEIIR